MTFRDYLSLYKYTWIFSAVFFVLSAILLALGNIIPQFFVLLFIFSTAISFISIFIVNAIILTRFRNNKRYMKIFRKINPENNDIPRRDEGNSIKNYEPDYVNSPRYSSMPGNVYYGKD
ncbi:MAG: hypothetical protein O2970_12220 [Proteobacteria bacterium]|nr:hypothetical protein [Pseudomonadota bacterium]